MPRRVLLSGLFAPVVAAAGRDPSTVLPAGATVLVAGPQGGGTDRWAEAISRALAPSKLRREAVGGPDGVTGANQFEARTAPDGDTALLAPGSAATAWLVGDTRAQFDAGRWVPVLASVGSGVLVSRTAPNAGAALRLAVSQVAGPDLPGLLGLDMLGVAAEPVTGLAGTDAQAALASGQVDAAFLHGPGTAATVQALAAQGIPAQFTAGGLDDAGQPARDPRFPDLPGFTELMRRDTPAGRLYSAWRAVAAAATLEVALVLPREAPANSVAQWRRACAQVAGSPELQTIAAMQEARPLVAAPASTSIAIAAPDADTLLELRRWLGQRYGWHPG